MKEQWLFDEGHIYVGAQQNNTLPLQSLLNPP